MKLGVLKKLLIPKEIDTTLKNFVIVNLGAYYIKGLIIKENKIIDYFIEPNGDFATLLKRIWQEKKITTNKVKVSIKNPFCLVRYFPFIKLEKKKLKEALFYELSKHIPYQPQEVYFDFSILEERSQNEVFLLLAVAKQEIINQIIETFKKQNLEVSQITLDSLCLINLFLDNYNDNNKQNVALLDIGYSSSTLIIIRKGIPVLTRELTFNVKDIFGVISNLKNLQLNQVESWIFSLHDKNALLELIQENIINLYKEMRTSFDYFEVNSGENINKIFLTGGLSSADILGKFLKDILGIDLEILSLGSNSEVFSDEKFKTFKNSFSVAFGLYI
ncbi:MAG: pilus assembly protein PilM [Candidatus Omnitrophica bacterium]|nr:pilus assembly protein PilM [Candidatus Omnitrophota bacterium]